MIYLVGVDHLIQYNNYIVPENIFNKFREYLTGMAIDLNILLMAEEFSEEALYRVYCASESTVKSVADSLNIRHRFCDPEENDRVTLGIPYFGDIKDQVEKKHNVNKNYIADAEIYKKIRNETAEISKSFWKIREEFWLNRISDSLSDNILFICGHEHIPGFKNLLMYTNTGCEILNKFWMGEIFSDYKNFNLF